MRFTETDIPDVRIIKPQRLWDSRGFFSETYNQAIFSKNGISELFVQDNMSYSAKAYTLRGLHFQVGPSAQVKIIRVLQGSIFDVAVDIRKNSRNYGRYIAVQLSADNGLQLYVPVGFARGFLTLTPHTANTYKMSNYHSPAHERGVLWSDPDLAIPWPLDNQTPTLSSRDKNLPLLRNCPLLF